MNRADFVPSSPPAAAVFATLPHAQGVAQAPGRVNLIGEHIDYNGFAVLPLALDRVASIAWAPRAAREVLIRNIDPLRWPAETIELQSLSDRPRAGTWIDYVVAGLRCRVPAQGLELVVGSDVPPAAGLSSSAALVVASLLIVERDRSRPALAELAARAERYVGTEAGGMDQAISLLARAGHALRIDFRPLRSTAVPLGDALSVLVAPSGVLAEKGGAAQAAYNQRVRECSAAARALGAPPGGLLADVPGDDRLARAARLTDPVLAARARFVFEEAERVDRAVEALQKKDYVGLGALLDASHAGLRDLYEVSHPAVDECVEQLRAAGVLGARIVGAGFGGCAVAVCHREDLARIRRAYAGELWSVNAAGAASVWVCA